LLQNPEDMMWVIQSRQAAPIHVLVSHFSVLVKDKMRVNPVGFKTIDKKNFFCLILYLKANFYLFLLFYLPPFC
jgi:hypothetical protein